MNSARMKQAIDLALPYGVGPTALDGSPALVLQYVPDAGTGGSAATVALVQDGDMTFLVDSAAPANADAIGTAGVIDTSAAGYDTIGELADAINGTQAWRAYIVGALRSDDCAELLAKSATSCLTANGLAFYWDSSACTHHTTAVSGEKFFNYGKGGYVSDAKHGCVNSVLSMRIGLEFASNGAGTIKVYPCTQHADGTAIFSEALTDATTTGINEFGLTDSDAVFLSSGIGQRLVIRAADDSTDDVEGVTDFTITGKTAVLSGAHVITEKNF